MHSRDPKRNRKLLLDTALDSVAEAGIAETTVRAIIERIGLSRGMVHLQFGRRDALLAAAAETFSNEYYRKMDLRLSLVSDNLVVVIMAFICAELSPETLNERSVGTSGAAFAAKRSTIR